MTDNPHDEVVKQAASAPKSKAKNIAVIAFIILFIVVNAIIIQVVGHNQKKKNMVEQDLPEDLSQGRELVQVKGCMNCHRFEDRVIGPSFLEVAERYNHDMKQVMPLSKKVRSGGGGNWGSVRMPNHSHIGDLQIQLMVAWILQYKGESPQKDNQEDNPEDNPEDKNE